MNIGGIFHIFILKQRVVHAFDLFPFRISDVNLWRVLASVGLLPQNIPSL
jgi:hypothetical protein